MGAKFFEIFIKNENIDKIKIIGKLDIGETMDERNLLSKDKKVFKENNMVKRPFEKWSNNIHSLLKHFYKNGLPVPKIIKTDNQYEYLEYINGELIHPYKWNNELLYELAILVKDLHSFAKSFENNKNMEWKQWYLREIGNPAICSHGDIAPWNVITKGNKITGLIDWEYAGPIDPEIELARVCWLFPQLFDDDLGKLYGLPAPKERAEQVRLITDTYGLGKEERKYFFEKIIETIICETAHEAIDEKVTFETEGKLWGMAWRNRSLYWIWRNKEILKKALE
jgi:thiamine kinase-like enzyme